MLAAIRACRHCVEAPHGKPLPHEPRPVLRASRTARLAVCSQAPGTKVHLSGTPFTDRSGDRLRDWMGVTAQEFYDEARVAIVPMGFCFPGQDAKGADLPPRRECATLWHGEIVRGAAAARAGARGRLLRARLASRRGGGDDAAGDDARLAQASQAQAASARAPAAAPLLAQQCDGSPTIRGSRRSFCRCCGARCGRCSEQSLALVRRGIIIY